MKAETPSRTGTVSRLLWQQIRRMFQRKLLYSEKLPIPALYRRSRSVFIRHLDCGSCNACELELAALENPLYDIERFGFRFEASPRHADVLILTGPFTRNLTEAALATLAAMPAPPKIITVGDCTCDGGIFKNSYAVIEMPAEIDITAHVAGCPPSPRQILEALARL